MAPPLLNIWPGGPGALGPGPGARGARGQGPFILGALEAPRPRELRPSPPPCHQSSPALPECYENKQIYKGPRSRKATQTGAMTNTGHHLPRGSAHDHDPSLLPFDNDGALALLERHRRAFFQTSSRDKTTSLRTQLFREIAVEMSQSEARPQKSHNLCSASFAPPSKSRVGHRRRKRNEALLDTKCEKHEKNAIFDVSTKEQAQGRGGKRSGGAKGSVGGQKGVCPQ